MGRKNRRRPPAPPELSLETNEINIPANTAVAYDKGKFVVVDPYKPIPNWKLHLVIFLVGLAIGTVIALAMVTSARAWPAQPPQIGRLVMPQQYWDWTVKAANDHHISPFIIQGVCVIESRYDPGATSGRGRCVGLMQLDKGVARGLGVDPWDPKENIEGGATILARLLRKHHGDLRKAIREYNGTGNQAYLREVLRAIAQAKSVMNQ